MPGFEPVFFCQTWTRWDAETYKASASFVWPISEIQGFRSCL